MRKAIAAMVVGLLAGFAVAADAPAAIPKEGSNSYFAALVGTLKSLPLGKDRVQLAYDVTGVVVSDTGEGILHNASVRCLGGMHVVNGAFEDETTACAYTRPDGDQVFTIGKSSGKQGVAAKGTVTYVGGTGKMAGITGGGETIRTSIRPAPEGVSLSYVRSKGTYKLP